MKDNGVNVSLLVKDIINVDLLTSDSYCNVGIHNLYSLDLSINCSSGISITTKLVDSIEPNNLCALMDCDGLLLLESDGQYLYALC